MQVDFAPMTRVDVSALFAELLLGNERIILAGLGVIAFLMIVARVSRGMTHGAGKVAA
jgi:hypothetical protein